MKLDLRPLKQGTPYTCVAACLRAVLDYYGLTHSEDEVARVCNTDAAGATLTEAAAGAESLGLTVLYISHGTLDMMIDWLQRNVPVIVGLAADELAHGATGGHAVVVCGIEGAHVLFLDPMLGAECRLDLVTFMRAWRRRNNRALAVLPPEQGQS